MREAPAMREAIEHLDRTPVEMKFATYIRGISATAGATPSPSRGLAVRRAAPRVIYFYRHSRALRRLTKGHGMYPLLPPDSHGAAPIQ